jgi:hypothetical protein
MKVLPVLALVLAVGCAPSVKSQADTAFSKKQYLQAAELYDQVLRGDPKDGHAQNRRTEARQAVLRELLANTARLRTADQTDAAMGALAEMLARRDGWGMVLDGDLAKAVTLEVVAAGSAIATAVQKTASSAGPLSAEAMAAHYAPLLAHKEFANWRHEIADSVTSAGRTACSDLAAKAKTPYVSWMIAGYCRHWGVADVEVITLPNLRSRLVVDGSLAGIPPEDSSRIRDTLAAAFQDSVWFSPQAPRSAHATLNGRLNVAFDQHTVSRTANWTEQVPYTDYVTEQESYQEPYDDTETYYEQVPHTEYHSESVPCGSSTCTESRPETVYSSESRTRTVTKYRTAYRSVTKPVTRYRDVPRSFTYEAVERSGRYTSQLRLRFDRDQPDIVAEITGSFFEHGFDHDAYNAAAGVSPERANLPSLADFTAREEGRLRDDMRAKLEARYGELYCGAARYTLEEAAACSYLAPQAVPAAVHAALRTAFGPDEVLLPSVLARGPQQQP